MREPIRYLTEYCTKPISVIPNAGIPVNAAGWNDFQLFLDNKPEYMDRVIAVNLGGALHLTHALLPGMIAAGGGKIVSVASDAGRVGSTGETVYAAAKAGLIGFTKSLAREMARYKINENGWLTWQSNV